MPSLSLIQSAIHDAHFLGEPSAAAKFVVANGLSAERRLGIYQNNTFITLTDALRTTFSVVNRLVGDEFFSFAAHAFLKKHPPRPGPLFEYGETFPDFLETFAPASSLAYLAGVGRLEWAWNLAYYAAEATSLKPADLQGIPTHHLPGLRFRLHPSHQFVTSKFPVERIWRANQPGADDKTIELDGGAELLVVRPRESVCIHRLEGGVFGFLMALDANQSVEIAHMAALAANPDFDLAQVLVGLFATGVFVASALDPALQAHKENVRCNL